MTSAKGSPEPDDASRRAAPRRESIARRLLARGPSAEERLIQFVEDRRREFAEQAARFERTLAELEQRELLLSDAKASIERLLRLGSKELDAREADLVRLMDELTERETRVHAQEEELARRRSDLGAVELKRMVVEQRERALEAREAQHGAAEEHRVEDGVAAAEATVAFVPGTSYQLVEIDPGAVNAGRRIVVEGEEYEILRVGPSPLPGDVRPCAYLVRGPGRGDLRVGSG